MADRSAVALMRALLHGDSASPEEALCGLLADDPPLALWVVCVAAEEDGLRPRSLDEVATWFAERALAALQWEPGGEVQSESISAAESQTYGDRVRAAVQLSDLAAQLAAEHGQAAAEEAFLLGLLSDAAGWTDGLAERLPDWLDAADDSPAANAIDLAAKVLVGQTPVPDSTGIDLEACRTRGTEARQRWLEPVPGIPEQFPMLTARLARLQALEQRFQETLETEKLEAMAEFAAGAGHEINNPLAVIAGRAQYFLREEEDPERRRALALMNAQAKRVYEMISDMMLFARPPQPEPEAVDVVELVEMLIEEFAAQASRQETIVGRSGDAGPVQLEVDRTQLTVALRAMLQNSLEAIGYEGRIEIGVRGHERHVEIRVNDDGPGISAEQRRHLFDPYYAGRQAGRGLGLGLSKCWRIVTNHGGRIDVDSSPGQGTRFTITLPQKAATGGRAPH